MQYHWVWIAEKAAQEEKDRAEGKPEKKKRKAQRKKSSAPCSTAGEAIEKMLKEKKLSQKINYDALKQLREGSSLATPQMSEVKKQEALSSGTLMPPPTSRGYDLKISNILPNLQHLIIFPASFQGGSSPRLSRG